MEHARERRPEAQPITVSAPAPPSPALADALVPATILALQRTAGNAKVSRMLAARAAAPAIPDDDRTGGLRWHLQIEPGSGVIEAGTVVEFRIRNDDGRVGGFTASPKLTLTSTKDITRIQMVGPPRDNPILEDNGFVAYHKLEHVGPVDVLVEAPAAHGERVRVTARVDVVGKPTPEALEATSAAERDEERRLSDPSAAPGEVGQVFRRAATRRAIDIVNSNLKEAEALKKRYAEDPGAMAEVAEAAALDLILEARRQREATELAVLREQATLAARLIPENGTDPERQTQAAEAKDAVADAESTVEALDAARELMREAVPAFGLTGLGKDRRREIAHPKDDKQRGTALDETLDKLIADCDATRSALARGKLDVLASETLVARLRKELGIDADPRKQAAVDAMLEQRRSDHLEDMFGLTGLSLLVLLIPGVGEILAAAMAAGGVGFAWDHAAKVEAAAGSGLMTQADAGEATVAAILETVLFGVFDVLPIGLKALKHVKVPRGLGGKVKAFLSNRANQRGRVSLPWPKSKKPRPFGTAPYKVPSPGLDRHEVLQNAWLQVRGHVTRRLTGRASRMNPTLRLPNDIHKIVNRYQRALGLYDKAKLAKWDVKQVLALNALALHHAGVPEEIIEEVLGEAMEHAVWSLGANLNK